PCTSPLPLHGALPILPARAHDLRRVITGPGCPRGPRRARSRRLRGRCAAVNRGGAMSDAPSRPVYVVTDSTADIPAEMIGDRPRSEEHTSELQSREKL